MNVISYRIYWNGVLYFFLYHAIKYGRSNVPLDTRFGTSWQSLWGNLILLGILFCARPIWASNRHCHLRSVNFEMPLWYISSILQKNDQKFWLYYYGASSRIVSVCLLGELNTPKRHFEVNWPLNDGWKKATVGTVNVVTLRTINWIKTSDFQPYVPFEKFGH